jgi:hypothetical protein
MLSSFSSIFNKNDTQTTFEKFDNKREQLSLTYQKSLEKVIFAFFLDKGQGALGKKEFDFQDLSSYEWYSGSLSREILVQAIHDFLREEISQQLDSTTREALFQFVELAGREVGYEVDLLRQEDIRLVLLMKTGMPFFIQFPQKEFDEEKWKEVTHKTITELKSLQPGQKALFLSGDLLHEMPILVNYTLQKEWEIELYDSGVPREARVLALKSSAEAIFNEENWHEIYQKKFKEDATHHLRSAFHKFGSIIEQNQSHRMLATQAKNTCHTQGLMAVIKNLILQSHPDHSNQFIVEWKLFKTLFGKFLANKKEIENKTLKHFCLLKQASREKKQETISLLYRKINEGNYAEVVKEYCDIFSFLQGYKDEEHLIRLHYSLINYLDRYYVTPLQYAPYFEKAGPCVQHTFQIYCERFEDQKQEFEYKLKQEIEHADSAFYLLGEEIEKLSFFKDLKATYQKTQNLMGAQYSDFDCKKLLIKNKVNSSELDDYLNLLRKHPEWLKEINKRKYLQCLLLQGIQNGKIEEVQNIIDQLPENDQEKFYTNLIGFRIQALLFPPEAFEFALENPKLGISKVVIRNMGREIIREGNIKKILKISYPTSSIFETIQNNDFIYFKQSSCKKQLSELKDFLENKHNDGEYRPLLEENCSKIISFILYHCLIEKDFETLRNLFKIDLSKQTAIPPPQLFLPAVSFNQEEREQLLQLLRANSTHNSTHLLFYYVKEFFLSSLLISGEIDKIITLEKEENWILRKNLHLSNLEQRQAIIDEKYFKQMGKIQSTTVYEYIQWQLENQ